MAQTPFSNKCSILAQALVDWEESEEWQKTFLEYNLGYYFAFGAAYDMIILKDAAKKNVEDAWDNFCEIIGVDSYGEYANLIELVHFAAE